MAADKEFLSHYVDAGSLIPDLRGYTIDTVPTWEWSELVLRWKPNLVYLSWSVTAKLTRQDHCQVTLAEKQALYSDYCCTTFLIWEDLKSYEDGSAEASRGEWSVWYFRTRG